MVKANQRAFMAQGLINRDDGTRRYTPEELEELVRKETVKDGE